MALSLDKRLFLVGQHILRARLFLDLWFYFEEENSRRKIIETMRSYNDFFRYTPHAYLAAYVIYIAGVFDKKKGTISLERLFLEAKKQRQLKAEDIKEIGNTLAQARPIAEKVAILRNNAFAHRSGHLSYDDAFRQAAVAPSELRKLTDFALTAANRLLLACGLQDQFFTDLPRADAEMMMKALEKGA